MRLSRQNDDEDDIDDNVNGDNVDDIFYLCRDQEGSQNYDTNDEADDDDDYSYARVDDGDDDDDDDNDDDDDDVLSLQRSGLSSKMPPWLPPPISLL